MPKLDVDEALPPVIDPELVICDPHHHLWDRPGDRYLLADLQADIAAGHRCSGTVYIEVGSHYRPDGPESLRAVGETAWVASQAVPGVMQGIVAFVDLTQGAAAEEAIAAHMDAGAGRLRGGRHLIAWDDDVPTRAAGAGMLGTPAVRAAGRLLARHGLVFDATVFSRQLPELVEFARALPELTVVLDHFGMPLGVGRHAPRTEETWAHWRRDLVDLAGCPNVVVKIGGFGIPTIALPLPVTARPATAPGIVELWQATVDWLIDAFGPDRCMFESNFPVDRAVCSYRELWNAFKLLSRGLSPAERDAVLRRTAERTYDLAPLEPPP